jgi:16S rRNA G966 N2-methylase RsmD
LNNKILAIAAQDFINKHLYDDVHKIAMSKSGIDGVDAKELANQISAKKKSQKKLPTWFSTPLIYFPPVLSIEQTSSEVTAAYKATLATGETLIDVTAGFGVDSYYFSKKIKSTVHCEINKELLQIVTHNAQILGQHNTRFENADGLIFLKDSNIHFDTIYIDPVRRGTTGKVFMLKDCSPDVVANLDLLLERSSILIIKTAPMLDITAGLNELKNVSEIHIVSVRNEVKELLWVLKKGNDSVVRIIAVTINDQIKSFAFDRNGEEQEQIILDFEPHGFLYEPDAALLKSGAFDLIAKRYGLNKLHSQTQLYTSEVINPVFPGRIFRINRILSPGELKKEKQLTGNVIVRNYRDTPENLIKKYKIKSDDKRFLIFTESKLSGFIIVDAEIIQHY